MSHCLDAPLARPYCPCQVYVELRFLFDLLRDRSPVRLARECSCRPFERREAGRHLETLAGCPSADVWGWAQFYWPDAQLCRRRLAAKDTLRCRRDFHKDAFDTR